MKPLDLGHGVKGVRLEDLPPEAWQTIVGKTDQAATGELYQLLSVMYRAAQLVANGVASMPFELLRGESVVWQLGDELPEEYAMLRDFPLLLERSVLSLQLAGRAYWAHESNMMGNKQELRYLLASTMREEYGADGELLGFERDLKNRKVMLTPEEVVYFWLPDWAVETGPAENYPGMAAMASGGVLRNADQFLLDYFERGLVKATMLTYGTDSVMTPSDQNRLKAWWNRVMRGAKNAFKTAVIRGDIKPVVIGEGLNELENSELTEGKQYEVAMAFGVPQTLLFSNSANYATAQEEAVSFVTNTLSPLAGFVASVLNEQLFEAQGLHWKFRPDRMESMQRAELEKAEALQRLTGTPVITVNEARERLELDPIEGGDELAAGFDQGAQPQEMPAELPEPEEDAELPPAKAIEMARLKNFVANGTHLKRAFTSDILTPAEIGGLTTQFMHEQGEEIAHDFIWRSYP